MKLISSKLSKIISCISICIGLLVCIGWILDIPILKSIIPGAVTMKFSTSVSFIFSGITIYFISKYNEGKTGIAHIAISISGLVVLLFMVTLLTSYVFGVSSGIEQLFIRESSDAVHTLLPGMPSLPTAINFILIIVAGIFAFSESKLRRLIVPIGCIVSIFGLVSTVGYVVNQPTLYYSIAGISSAMAIHTSILFAFLGIALILSGNNTTIRHNDSVKIYTKITSLFLASSIIPIIFVVGLNFNILEDFPNNEPIKISMIIVSMVTIITVVIFLLLISKSISRPIGSLKNVAMQISKGNFSIKADESSSDEIGELSKTFNNMIDSIKMATALQIETEKLKQTDKDKEEFAAMISHELKTPLIPISGYAELFLDGSLGNITNLQKEKMQVMYENSIRLTTLIQDILDARKIELKRLNLDIQIESIKEIAKRCIDIFRPIAESKGIKLVDETQDIMIKCDPDRILQVLNNIISNAIKFVPAQDGTILINSRNDKDTVMISIKDNGIGIPKSKQDDLFKKFYQVDKSLTRKSGGTGLGLAISRGIVEAHGGKIWVESEENQGTTVHFTIQKGNGK